eukprot:g8914.t1
MSSVADNNNSKELNFDNKQWQDAEFAQMITELKVNTVVTQLSLKKCRLGPKQAKIIAEMLMVNASLKKINLSDNKIGDEGASAIAKGIQENKNCVLEELNLRYTGRMLEGAKSLAEMIKVNASCWEGGIRAASFIHAPFILKRTGISNDLFHVSDWYKSLFHAAAGETGVVQKISMKPNEVEWKKGDGIDNWACLASTIDDQIPSARNEIIISSQAKGSIFNTHAIRVGDMKLVWSPNLLYNNNLWYFPPGSKEYDYTIKCGKPPSDISDNLCEDENSPCLYNITADPCEYVNLAAKLPNYVQLLKAKINEYKKTTVLTWKQFHKTDPRALPSNHGGKVPIQPNTIKGGASEYNGVWKPWLTKEESKTYYPEFYIGPGY